MTAVSVHVLRFAGQRTWDDLRAARPDTASYWHPGVTAPPDDSGLPVPDLRSWTVLACWRTDEEWRRAVDAEGPWLGADEAWSALLAPGPTRSTPAAAQWADGHREPPFGAPAERPPLGPVAVVTTVGLAADDLLSALRFLGDTWSVVGSLAATPGSLGFRLGSAEHFPSQADPFTFSLWEDVKAARAWAYGTDVHVRAMARHTDEPHVTRGSFTTFSVVETRGTWTARHG